MSFFFNDTATTEIYTLPYTTLFRSMAYKIKKKDTGYYVVAEFQATGDLLPEYERAVKLDEGVDRKSTRLNSSHQIISYAVFCLKKKKSTYHCRHAALLSEQYLIDLS